MTKQRLDSLELAKHFFSKHIGPGSRVVDATAGRGKDTLFLARLTGSTGKVWAFDIQQEAIRATRKLLESENSASWVSLHQTGHQYLNTVVDGQIDGVMFNLGYLPGGLKSIITQPETTVCAVRQAVAKLSPGGLITLVLYTGHPGGRAEAEQVELFVQDLPQSQYDVLKFTYPNRGETTPYLIAVRKI